MESRLEKIFSMAINCMSLAVWLGEYTVPVWLGEHTVPVWLGDYTVPVWLGEYTVPVWLGEYTVPEEGWFGQPKYSTPS